MGVVASKAAERAGGILPGCRWLVAAAVQRPLLLLGTAAAYNPLHA